MSDEFESKLAELTERRKRLETRRHELREIRADAKRRLKDLSPARRDALLAAGLEVPPELDGWDPDEEEARLRTTERELAAVDEALSLLADEENRTHEARRRFHLDRLAVEIEKLSGEIARLEAPLRPLRERLARLLEARRGWEGGRDFAQYVRSPNDRR